MSIGLVMVSNHLLLCHPLLLLPSIFSSIRSFPVSRLFASGDQRVPTANLVILVTCKIVCSYKSKRHLFLERKAMTNLDSVLKSRDITLLTKVCIVIAMVFPVVMHRCENWTIKKTECQRICAFELWCLRRLQSPLDNREIKPVNPKGNQPWIFTERTDAEVEVPRLWPPDMKSRLIGKDSNAGKDWRQEDKGMTEDEVVGWHHWLNGHESEQTQIVKDREAWQL